MVRRHLAAAVLFLALQAVMLPAAAQEEAFADYIVMQADDVRYDDVNGITTATGNVEFAYQGRILQADTVTYNETTDLVIATGNVVLVEPTGEVLFSEYAEMTGDLHEGLIDGIRILLSDNSRLAANGARRFEGRVTEMSKAVYSPCELCQENPSDAPFWQVKADRVIHDQTLQDIIYHDATLELFGLPVLYTPYLRLPDPTVDRRSGLLTPRFGSSSTLGYNILIPYYFVLDPNRDATVSPLITEDEGLVMFGEYRERTQTGIYALDGSITYTDARDNFGAKTGGQEERWHARGEGLWNYGPTWQYGFEFFRSSDDSYLSRYSIDDSDTLTTSVYVEGFRGRSYASAFGYAFQGLRQADDQDAIPLALPELDYSLVTDPDSWGGFFTVDGKIRSLTRDEGAESNVISLKGGWERPLLTESGHLFTVRGSLRGDAYDVDDVNVGPGKSLESGFVGRIVPQASLEWRYPMMRTIGTIQQTIEPIVQAVWSPNGSNPEGIPNEDSQDFEFDEINLFSTNRFTGIDRVEGGLRINYGLRIGAFGFGGGRSELLIGQTWRERDDNTFAPESGFDGHFSDYVGRLVISPSRYVNLLYRFRIDDEEFSFKRSELGVRVGSERAVLGVAYIRLDEAAGNVVDTDGTREQIMTTARLQVQDEWVLSGDWREDLQGGGTISYSGAITYENECIAITGRAERRLTSNIGIDPETVLFFTVELRTLG
ncbi:MAG: LPS-assembly protein LptD [Rhodospirillales bacterium]|nr:LPS-assembly protein LptD [Rhodospirillales bacterium]